ncbi:hypothetical protein Y1Q_0008989 [Alligator mississippiensis]|uniref:Uncharacterized protein n=1 Tax=Alligator mississippiensis TaxID=8496 RepID=A0A151NU70_ALLMI|nr:hypothetical protein Y1Q_0008989 [Alligator mississippiensis]
MLERSSSTEDSKNLPMVQGISPTKANSSSRITKISTATMAPHKANRKGTIMAKATTRRTLTPTTHLVVEARTTTMRTNTVMVVVVAVVEEITMGQEVPRTTLDHTVAMGEDLGEEGPHTKVNKVDILLSPITTLQVQARTTVDPPAPTRPLKVATAETITA